MENSQEMEKNWSFFSPWQNREVTSRVLQFCDAQHVLK